MASSGDLDAWERPAVHRLARRSLGEGGPDLPAGNKRPHDSEIAVEHDQVGLGSLGDPTQFVESELAGWCR